MWIIIRPDSFGREPTIDFYKDGEIDTSPYKDYVIKQFHNIIELKCILLKCYDTSINIEREIGKDNKPTDTWYLNCLDHCYYIDNDSVAHTDLFRSWGLTMDIKTVNKELVMCSGFERRPYEYYE